MSEKRTIDDASHDEWEQENNRLAKSESAGATPDKGDIKGVAAVTAGLVGSGALLGAPWLLLGDCLEKMKEIPDGSVDLVLTDPPYFTCGYGS